MLLARNPRNGEIDYRVEPIAPDALGACAQNIRQNQRRWSLSGLEHRATVLKAFAAAIRQRRVLLQQSLEIDTGRRRIAAMEIESTIGAIENWCGIAPGLLPQGWIGGRAMPALRHTAQFVPYSLVGVISPWNFPLLLAMIDAIPALLAGSAVIVKPSEVTPRFIAPLMQAVSDVPALAQVFTVLHGDGGLGAYLVDTADCICFTGSVATGRKVALQAAGRFIPAFLELGGKDPLLVMRGADLEAASDAALRGSVLATGQACQSIERIYVDRQIYESFLAKLVAKANAASINHPDIAVGEVGPIIFDRQAEILTRHIADARKKGARVLTGGSVENLGGGLWLRPTVIADADHDMAVMREETFGPVLPVMPFDDEDEAVALANASEFGLSAAVFAKDLESAEAVARRIEAGAISLNDAALTALFHEAAKQSFGHSGIGPSRMGSDGFLRFFRRKALIANTKRPLPLCAFREEG